MSAAERLRVPSAGNLREPGNQYPPQPQQRPPQHQPPPPHGHFNRRDNRDLDKSKSIPNLHLDNSMDMRGNQGMRPAQSVSALQQQRMPNNADYYNQPHSLEESRNPDYENQPLDPRLRYPNNSMAPGYPNGMQPSPSQFTKPQTMNMPPKTSSPASSRGSQGFERPQSQYFGQQERPDFGHGRPKSEEISQEKLRSLQEMERSQGSPHDHSFENRTPNYSNIRPQPNYANQGEIRKMDVGSLPKQPNFYENTVPRQQEPMPPFQQLRRPPSESEKSRPPTAPKPAVSAKPNLPLVQPAEIPRSEVDNRQTQPHFYNPRINEPYNNSPHQSFTQSSPNSHYQNTSFHNGRMDSRSKLSPGQDPYYNKGMDMPPPPHEIPPELPPPPLMEDPQDDDLPPLPPPPVNDFRLEQKIREEESRMFQHQSDPSYSNLPPPNSRNQPLSVTMIQTNGQRSPQNNFVGNQPEFQPAFNTGYQPPHSAGFQPPHSAGFQPQQTHSLPPHSSGYQPSHDYQNINYSNRNTESSQLGHSNLYETYDPKLQNAKFRPGIQKEIKEQREAIVSPWDREEKEKQKKQQEDNMVRLRDMEISELETRHHRSPAEEERLRKLLLDREFQRRLQEVSSQDDEDESDDDRFVS